MNESNTTNNGAVLVSWNFSEDGENDVLVVGEKHESRIKVINSFQGKDARNIYKKLFSNKKEGGNK